MARLREPATFWSDLKKKMDAKFKLWVEAEKKSAANISNDPESIKDALGNLKEEIKAYKSMIDSFSGGLSTKVAAAVKSTVPKEKKKHAEAALVVVRKYHTIVSNTRGTWSRPIGDPLEGGLESLEEELQAIIAECNLILRQGR